MNFEEIKQKLNFPFLIKQPWFWILTGLIISLLVITGSYYVGKHNGRSDKDAKLSKENTKLLADIQEALSSASAAGKRADAFEKYAFDLKKQIKEDKEKALFNEALITKNQKENEERINKFYEADKTFIRSDLNDCERCRDVCRRAKQLADSYPADFSQFDFDEKSKCSEYCESR